MKKLALLVVMALVVPALAHAGAIPNYNSEKFCETISSGKRAIYNACIDLEQKAYDDLKKRWARIPQPTKDFCGAVGKGADSYQAFKECEVQQKAGKKTLKR